MQVLPMESIDSLLSLQGGRGMRLFSLRKMQLSISILLRTHNYRDLNWQEPKNRKLSNNRKTNFTLGGLNNLHLLEILKMLNTKWMDIIIISKMTLIPNSKNTKKVRSFRN